MQCDLVQYGPMPIERFYFWPKRPGVADIMFAIHESLPDDLTKGEMCELIKLENREKLKDFLRGLRVKANSVPGVSGQQVNKAGNTDVFP